ncbi:expressed unknown protein [Seminavis robusta]|uniref:Uncharacterized protein n=1 Tax=Seminavis robusta TaxID=568900 RepID=A0A9N8E2Q8_9STRA|nr:expressed unknown protein [Seminavis robusta]|eukprot:Sro485_g152400.1 n/a (342) ;mRNA; f:30906-31931
MEMGQSNDTDSTAMYNATGNAAPLLGSNKDDSNNVGGMRLPLELIIAVFVFALAMIIVAMESIKAVRAMREYHDFKERAKKQLQDHHHAKRRQQRCDDCCSILPLLGGRHEYHFQCRYSDSSFYQTRVLPEIYRGWFHRSRLRRNIGDHEIETQGVLVVIDEAIWSERKQCSRQQHDSNPPASRTYDNVSNRVKDLEECEKESNNSSAESQRSDIQDQRLLSLDGYGTSPHGTFEITEGYLCPFSGRCYWVQEDIDNCCRTRKVVSSGFFCRQQGEEPGSLRFSGTWRANTGATGQSAQLTLWPATHDDGKPQPSSPNGDSCSVTVDTGTSSLATFAITTG